MKTLILSAIAASALFATGTPAQAYHYGGGHGGGYYGDGYGGGYAAPGPYVDVGSYDAYRGYGRHGGYGIRPATVRRSYGHSSVPRYTTRSYTSRPYALRTLGPSYVSRPYTLPTHSSQSYGLPSYTYRYPSHSTGYSTGGGYSGSYAVPASYGYGSGSVNTVPYGSTYTGSYDYRCGC